MTENINASIKKAAECAASVLAALAGIWWGIRMGGGLYYRTGADLRLPLILLMLAGLLMQGYSSVKTDRKYNALYRIGIWISGILISLLIYSLFFLLIGDIAILIVRHFLHIQTASGHGTFRMVVFGAAPEVSPAACGDVWGSPVWNFETPPLLGLILSGAVTLFGISHARRLRVTSYKISFPDFHRKECGNTSKRSTKISKAENPMRSPEPSQQHAEMSGTDPRTYLVRARYRKSEGLLCGFTDRGNTKSIVSSGTGFFQIPIRIGTNSEIVCIDLNKNIDRQ